MTRESSNVTLPPEPLHTNLLGPVIDDLEKIEEIFEDEMNYFYKLQCLNKNGEGPGGKFNGPSLKTVLNKLEELEKIVQTKGFPFIEYLQIIKELHMMCISEKFNENYDTIINEFKCKFFKVYENFNLPLTLKIHVIVDHYADYFKETGKNFRLTNGAIHHTIKVFE